MLRTMTMPMLRRLGASWAAVLVIASAAAVRADDAPAPGPKPSEQASTGSATELPPLPSSPNTAAPGEPAPGAASQSSEPPAPSEYDYAADTDPAALTDFRDALSPYGTWEDDATYGVVWMPSTAVVGADFAPYVSHGHWALGVGNSWLWVSDFSWGWAPFHYGRWAWIGGRGWGWIPGRVYAPAWVVWRTGFYDDYYVGWAPMPPSWYWRRGWAYRLGFYPPASYVFCSASYVFSPHVRSYIAPPSRVNLIAPRTRPYVAASPSVAGAAPTAHTMTRGPSMVEANVPAGSVPTQRVAPEPRAVAYARTQQPSRTFTSTQPDAFGRTDVMPRPLTPGSSLHSTGPLPPIGANVPRSQDFGPRQLYPTPAPMQRQPMMPMVPRAEPVMPTMPRPAPAVPSMPSPMPHVYNPPSSPSFSRPAPPQMMRPFSPSPALRPSAPPAVNMPRPSMVAPPAVRSAPVGPRIVR
jgi:hypothetical protein